MPSLKHIRVGDPITADLLNKIADRLEPWSKMTVAQGSHLNFMDGPFGKALVLMLPREIPARLIGDSSPYAWTALTEEPDGEYSDRTGGLLGGEAAYEINGKADLDGKVVMLRWSAAGDWRFQYIGYGTPTCLWSFVVKDLCSGKPIEGAVVSVKQSGDEVATCTTGSGEVLSVTRTNGGSGGTNGSYTDGTFTGGGGSGATFSYTIVSGVVQTAITVTAPGSGYTSAPTPVFGPAAHFAAATAAIGSRCTLDAPAGTYDVEITPPEDSPYAPYTASVAHTCDQLTTVQLDVDSDHLCGGCGPCLIYPKVISVTWDFDPDYLGYHYPDDILTLGPPIGGDKMWYGATPFPSPVADGDARLVISCQGTGVNSFLIRHQSVAGGSSPRFSIGNLLDATITCEPFSIINAKAGGAGESRWNAIG